MLSQVSLMVLSSVLRCERLVALLGLSLLASALNACSLIANPVFPPRKPQSVQKPGMHEPLPSSIKILKPNAVRKNNLASRDRAFVGSVTDGHPPGLKLAQARLVYNDGDELNALFRVFCPTEMIRPTQYRLVDATGQRKKQGDWWEPAFTPRWQAEKELVARVCA